MVERGYSGFFEKKTFKSKTDDKNKAVHFFFVYLRGFYA